MDSLEMTGKTTEEATDKALRQLGLELEDVVVDVVDRGRGGILGLGSELARVIVRPRPPELVDLAKETIEGLLRAMGVAASVGLPQRSSGPGEKAEAGAPAFNIDGEDAGLLIGRRGETLASLQFLLNFIVSRRSQERVNIRIDVEGYRDRREESLRVLANRMLERAVSTGRTVTMEPMPARERRIIHITLAASGKVTTESVGEGEDRKVTIVPKPGVGGRLGGPNRADRRPA